MFPDMDQTFTGDLEDWAKAYLRMFVASAKRRCDIMYRKYVLPFEKYV